MGRDPGHDEADDQMLAVLAHALVPPPVDPPADAVREVRLLAARQGGLDLAGTRAGTKRRGWLVLGVSAGVVVIGAGSAFAAGVKVPGPLRALAVHIGLSAAAPPATTAANASVQRSDAALHADLRRGSRTSPHQIAIDARALATALTHARPPARPALRAQSRHELTEACSALARDRDPAADAELVGVCPAPTASVPSAPASSPVPAGTAPTTSVPGPAATGPASCSPAPAPSSPTHRTGSKKRRSPAGTTPALPTGKTAHGPRSGHCPTRRVR